MRIAPLFLLVALARGEDDTFDIMDRDGDGLVKTEEIQSAWARPDVYGNAADLKDEADRTMNWADANGDDAISRKEWADANAKDGKDEKDYGEGWDAAFDDPRLDVEVSGEDEFRRADADADGHLTPEELAAHWAGGDPDATSEQARKYAAEMTVQESDSDKDGQLSEDEWSDMYSEDDDDDAAADEEDDDDGEDEHGEEYDDDDEDSCAPAPPSLPARAAHRPDPFRPVSLPQRRRPHRAPPRRRRRAPRPRQCRGRGGEPARPGVPRDGQRWERRPHGR